MKIEGYEEISEREYRKLPNDEGIEVRDCYKEEFHYFKKAQKFPICFEDEHFRIEIDEDDMVIYNKLGSQDHHFGYEVSFPLLKQAMKEIEKRGLDKKGDKEE